MADHAIPTNDFPVGADRERRPTHAVLLHGRRNAEQHSSSIHAIWDTACTDLNCLCYNSLHGAGTAALGWCCLKHIFGQRFSLVSMVSINLGIWFYEVETGDAGESIEPEESH